MITSIPILTREGADVLYQEANKGIYAFKITVWRDIKNSNVTTVFLGKSWGLHC